MPRITDVLDRIDVALEKLKWRKKEVRTICLSQADMDLFDAVNTKAWRDHLGSTATFYATRYRGHFLRTGSRSVVYGENGEEVAIPKRLSKKVAP